MVRGGEEPTTDEHRIGDKEKRAVEDDVGGHKVDRTGDVGGIWHFLTMGLQIRETLDTNMFRRNSRKAQRDHLLL